ncbi:MAG: hypothetical protein HOL17_06270 [Gammaproteobacteria bacterium]|nr:hypothetical protein [Gammaproteobacteria bacterium]MBT4606035.1 hypothetical protein [Thiotrichales bacterium]MBT7829787.1 hypothetical protein [Candidatus Neomarinimicrobiota bacterium]MBT4329549.1 hypothetical protein [Gammaproteobacteria bacterium]MBT5371312.1 hypothetical protein [Gammaproteobacteria bacterium]
MSNPLKSVGKAVGKVFKSVTKVVKKIAPVAIAAAAIYFGGYAMANGTMAGSGTHLSSLITGSAGQGASLFVPGANSAAANMIAGKGMTVGSGMLGGSGVPGFGSQKSVATINSANSVGGGFTASNAASVPASSLTAGASNGPSVTGLLDLPGTAGVTPNAVGSTVSPLAGGGSSVTGAASAGEAALGNGFSAAGAVSPDGLLAQVTPISKAASSALSPVTAAANAVSPKGLLSQAWNGLGDYGKYAAIQGGTQMVSGYAQGEAQEEQWNREKQENEEAQDRMNARQSGGYQYVPGQGLVFVPAGTA